MIGFIRQFAKDARGAASSEFVLAIPMILPLIFGSMEAGNFFWSQQKLTQSVRDGARFASRQNYGLICPNLDSDLETDIKNITRTGLLSGGTSKLPGWENSEIDVVPNCGAFTAGGIYSGYGGAGAIVTVRAVGVPYRSILGALGVIDDTYKLAAEVHSPVIGI
ncbi:TadE/TadG family type IV pilus assembly protein [Croceicoccus naphthovorans]|uniref:Uncharacterized protein n=1 Tax=Croceicoccus naphthovorans TaxID=1348774 RepID=A0A0G3XG16_9SPHN|nr:TadE/TadG family type IV pilus assembly protein [Croceicoccus naphthovorans]AKM09534.1 hypothetical protein AB433_05335 [Croceicoccus naphthovorans]MBB3989718.1 hypothetical protein [Croceicoccus naphthovorans]